MCLLGECLWHRHNFLSSTGKMTGRKGGANDTKAEVKKVIEASVTPEKSQEGSTEEAAA